MLVVADSSPLNILIQIDHVEILPALFKSVMIPRMVAHELNHANTPDKIRAFMAARPEWLEILEPLRIELIP